MPNLIDTLDLYKEFSRVPYFIICFNKLPSSLSFSSAIKENKKSMEAVLAAFDFDKLKLQEIFKDWDTESEKDADSSEDYPFQYLFKSEQKDLIIWVSFSGGSLFVEFLYDGTDLSLEREVISMNQILRENFGRSKSPTFKVLTFKSNNFETSYVQSEFREVNIDELYNDDFREVNEIVEKSLESEKAGLILLYGAPGTGKTSYIKNLISKFSDNNFIFIQNEFVKDLLKPEFISFLMKNRNSILIIEDAEKVITSRESLSENSVVSTILQLTDGLFSDYLNTKIICTFNTNIEKVDKALLRKGRLIASYEFKFLSVEKSNKLLKSLGHNTSNTEMALSDIFNYDKKAFDTTGNKKKIGFY